MTFATVTLTQGSVTLTGYMMEDGTFEFFMQGRMQKFPTLMAAWQAWADHH